MPKLNFVLGEEELKSTMKLMLADSGVDSFAVIARRIGMNENTFRAAVSNGSIRLADFVEAAKIMGYKITVEPE